MDFIERRKSEDCGCPEEDWILNGIYTTIHLEDDGSGHILLDFGDNGEEDKLVECDGSMKKLLSIANDWTQEFLEQFIIKG